MRFKKICIIILIMVTILFTANEVLAANAQTEITTTKQEIQAKEEETTTLNFKLNNFQEIEDGLYAYKGQIQYDKNVFYELETKDFEVKNDWTNLEYNKQNNEFVVIKKSGVTNPEEFLQIKLKVKNDAKAGSSNIVIKNQTTSEGKDDIEIDNLSMDIKIIQEDDNNPGIGDNDNNNSGDSNQGDNENNIAGDSNQNNNQGGGKPSIEIPKTGLGNYQTLILIAIEVLIIIAIYSFVKYKKINKKIKIKNKKMLGMILAIVLTAQIVGTTYAAVTNIVQKGEVNGDGVIDYTDVKLVEKHLIGLEELISDKLRNADLNEDNKITVTDLTLLIKKIENKREYVVELENVVTDNYHPNKNQEIEISFMGKINYEDVSIKKVIINDKEYEVQKTNDEYKLKLNVGDRAEKQDFRFSKVMLSTGDEVKIDYNFSVSVLKDKPFIDEKTYKLEETFEGKANVSFDLIDTENSILSAEFTVYEKAELEGENIPVVETPIKSGNNKQEIPVEDGKTYIVQIKVDYNLAPEQLPENEYQGENIIYSKEFTVNLDYKFKISDIKTLKNDIPSTIFTKGEQIQVSFNSTNAAFEETKNNTFKPTIVTINGKEYQVIEKDNNYIATIDGIELLGNQIITIEKVKLGNGKEFTLDKNNNVQIRIEEKIPSIINFEAQENVTDRNIKIKFNIIDEENAIKSAKIVLYDSKKNVIKSKDLSIEEIKKGIIEATLKTKETTKYVVQVIATYNVTDVEVAENKVLLEQDIPAIIYANIKQADIDKTEVEKNEKVNITYTIETNSEQPIEKIRVNSVDYDVTNKLQVNVLKDVPTINDIKQEDSVGNHEVTLSFTINDTDKSYISGKVQLVKNGNVVEEKEIIKNENGVGTVTFDHVEEGASYTAKVLATYNRFVEAEEHIQKDQLLEEIPVILIHDYKLQVSNLKTANKEKETIYFNKNEEIILNFTSTNASNFIPENVIINGKTYTTTRKI